MGFIVLLTAAVSIAAVSRRGDLSAPGTAPAGPEIRQSAAGTTAPASVTFNKETFTNIVYFSDYSDWTVVGDSIVSPELNLQGCTSPIILGSNSNDPGNAWAGGAYYTADGIRWDNATHIPKNTIRLRYKNSADRRNYNLIIIDIATQEDADKCPPSALGIEDGCTPFFDINNDGVMDYIRVESRDRIGFWLSQGFGYIKLYTGEFDSWTMVNKDYLLLFGGVTGRQKITAFSIADVSVDDIYSPSQDGYNAVTLYPIDADNDGDIELFDPKTYAVYKVDHAGKISKSYLPLREKEEEETEEEGDGEGRSFVAWDYSMLASSMAQMFGVDGDGYTSSLAGGDFQTMDLNGDGLPDFINCNSGNTYINIGDGSYYPQSFSGQTFFTDLNGDGLSDFVNLNGTDLISYITDPEGNSPASKKILSGFKCNYIWSKDVDRDGDKDLVLVVTGNGQTYGAVMENDGKGNFKRHEVSLPNLYMPYNYSALALADWDNDGNYELLSIDANNRSIVNSYEISGTKINTTAEIALTLDGDYQSLNLYTRPTDGKVLWTWPEKKEIVLSDNANERPTPPAAAPSITYEAKTGLVKIAWTPGADKETPAADLEYALRIGTTPGADDIVSAHTYSDGVRKIADAPSNIAALQRIYDATGWPEGKLYVAVQAIDGNGQGSAFTENAFFEKTTLPNEFALSYKANFCITDTLTLTPSRPIGGRYTALWDTDGGKIISTDGATGECKVIYYKGGSKTISLQVKDNDGNISAPRTKTLYVMDTPLHVTSILLKDREPFLNEQPYTAIDLDEDGIDEFYIGGSGTYGGTYGSFWESVGDGVYSHISRMFNSHQDVPKFWGTAIATVDVNGDGLCDIVGAGVLGYNLGDLDMDFETFAENNAAYGWIDFDNDGKLDKVRGGVEIRRNDGDYKTFDSNIFRMNYAIIGDYNNDGLPDIAVYPRYTFDEYITIYYNNGDFTVKEGMQIKKPEDYVNELYRIDDYDCDGLLDLVYRPNSGDLAIAFGNGRVEKIEGTLKGILDLNNDGLKDFITSSYIYYQTATGALIKESREQSVPDEYGGQSDVDEFVDAIMFSDGTRKLAAYRKDGGMFTGTQIYPRLLTFNLPNERPLPPTNIHHTQNDKFVVIEWEHSVDKETPAANMRYNISIKHKGAEGEGAYLFSPANSGKNGVRVPLHKPLLSGNCFTIPISNIPAGDYEVMVQGVDLMRDQSDFSDIYYMHVDESASFDAPASGEVNVPVAVKVLVNTDKAIDWDGGEVSAQASGVYDIVWKTPGIKTVSVDGSSAKIKIDPAPDGSFVIPAGIRYGDCITVKGKMMNQGEWCVIEKKYVGSNGNGGGWNYEDVHVPLTSKNNYAQLEIIDDETVALTPLTTSSFEIHHFVSSRFSTQDYTHTIRAPFNTTPSGTLIEVTTVANPSIDFVTADGATGKYKVQWSNPDKVRLEATGINVYRETSRADDYQLVASLPLDATEWTDSESNPDIVASRYVIAYQLTFGRSRYSTAHQPVHVMINRGAGTSWNLIWGSYEGGTIPQYRILRGDSPENLSVIAEVSGHMTSYTDFTAPAAGALYYAVESVLTPAPQRVAARSGRDAGISPRSNVVSAAGSNINLAESIKVISVDGNDTLDGASGATSIQLKAVINPTTTTFMRPSWIVISGDDLVWVDNSGCVRATGNGSGTATVRAMTIDGSGLYADFAITVSGYSGIGSVTTDSEGRINVYPSPAREYISIDLSGNDTDLYIFSLGGKIAWYEKTDLRNVQIDCSAWPSGVYIVKAVDHGSNTSSTSKFIKL